MAAFLPVAVLLSLLVTGATADGYGSQTPSPSTRAPATPPKPAPAPAAPPTPAAHGYDDKKLVVVHVRGVVLCQSCAKKGSQSLDGGATPLPRANVTVTCRDRKNCVMAYRQRATDSNGYFDAEFGVQRADYYLDKDPLEACFVRLLSSPDAKCNIVTDINGGMLGAPVRDEGKQWTDDRGFKNVVYAAGPLAFMPEKCEPTHHYESTQEH